ncbi:hypothetical protein DFA_01994 [Cavenderia fasciculata]|uniref:Uncharacterized protein n=1 Tax=Cavenderia fasciculata TaxID=261658 RepID=F4PR47_CACFS|nr:uncharacterized protein DFA_01994 [Cavenderia fasciculata]EGG22104.1 hypothetical protein DFA_01994 [Cavenderia fasciculata]|eukprot:XP_004359955.1 hypothetical protein DFA_01994 [Cavenderia fasciculata]
MSEPSVRALSSAFESASSPGDVNKESPSYDEHSSTGPVSGASSSSPSVSPSNLKRDYTAGVDNERIIGAKERSSVALDKFLKNEVIPRGGTPGSSHKSAIGKPAPNENDNKAKSVPKFSGSSHPVYGLMLAGKQHESSVTKKKIVIPPSNAY